MKLYVNSRFKTLVESKYSTRPIYASFTTGDVLTLTIYAFYDSTDFVFSENDTVFFALTNLNRSIYAQASEFTLNEDGSISIVLDLTNVALADCIDAKSEIDNLFLELEITQDSETITILQTACIIRNSAISQYPNSSERLKYDEYVYLCETAVAKMSDSIEIIDTLSDNFDTILNLADEVVTIADSLDSITATEATLLIAKDDAIDAATTATNALEEIEKIKDDLVSDSVFAEKAINSSVILNIDNTIYATDAQFRVYDNDNILIYEATTGANPSQNEDVAASYYFKTANACTLKQESIPFLRGCFKNINHQLFMMGREYNSTRRITSIALTPSDKELENGMSIGDILNDSQSYTVQYRLLNNNNIVLDWQWCNTCGFNPSPAVEISTTTTNNIRLFNSQDDTIVEVAQVPSGSYAVIFFNVSTRTILDALDAQLSSFVLDEFNSMVSDTDGLIFPPADMTDQELAEHYPYAWGDWDYGDSFLDEDGLLKQPTFGNYTNATHRIIKNIFNPIEGVTPTINPILDFNIELITNAQVVRFSDIYATYIREYNYDIDAFEDIVNNRGELTDTGVSFTVNQNGLYDGEISFRQPFALLETGDDSQTITIKIPSGAYAYLNNITVLHWAKKE